MHFGHVSISNIRPPPLVYMTSSASSNTEWKAGRVSIVLGGDGRGPAPLIKYSALSQGGDDERKLA